MIKTKGMLVVTNSNEKVYLLEEESSALFTVDKEEDVKVTLVDLELLYLTITQHDPEGIKNFEGTVGQYISILNKMEECKVIVETLQDTFTIIPKFTKFNVNTLLLAYSILFEKGIRRYIFTKPYAPSSDELWRVSKDLHTEIENCGCQLLNPDSFKVAMLLKEKLPGGQIYLIKTTDGQSVELAPSVTSKSFSQLFVYVSGAYAALPQYTSDLLIMSANPNSDYPVIGFCKGDNISYELIVAPELIAN